MAKLHKVHLIDVDADGDTGKVACNQRNVPRDRRVGYLDGEQITCGRCKRALQTHEGFALAASKKEA